MLKVVASVRRMHIFVFRARAFDRFQLGTLARRPCVAQPSVSAKCLLRLEHRLLCCALRVNRFTIRRLKMQAISSIKIPHSSLVLAVLVLIALTSVYGQVLDTGTTQGSNGLLTPFERSLPFAPWGGRVLWVIISYFIGKGLELITNRYVGYGFRYVPFKKEIRSILLICHELTIFSDNLGIFADHKNRSLNKFVKFLERRVKRGGGFRPVRVLYGGEGEKALLETKSLIERRLKEKNLSDAIELVEWSGEFPQSGYVGRRIEYAPPGWNWFRPRYWVRYRRKEFHSGVVTSGPFLPSTSREQYEILVRLIKCELETK